MKRQFRLMERVGKMEEPIFSLPLIELWGDGRVLIERHGGVIDYGTEKITVRVNYGSVSVEGVELTLCKLCAQQLVITGTIASISIHREGKI